MNIDSESVVKAYAIIKAMNAAERDLLSKLISQTLVVLVPSIKSKSGRWTTEEESRVIDWILANPQKAGKNYEAWLAPLCRSLGRDFNSVYQKQNRLRIAKRLP
jgi:hypothetical protein